MAQAGGLPNVNTVGLEAPLRWLGRGWGDFTRTLGPSLFYGLAVAGVSFFLARALVETNLAFWALTLSCGFVFVAPMLAMGLYEAGRALKRANGQRWRRCCSCAARCVRMWRISGWR